MGIHMNELKRKPYHVHLPNGANKNKTQNMYVEQLDSPDKFVPQMAQVPISPLVDHHF